MKFNEILTVVLTIIMIFTVASAAIAKDSGQRNFGPHSRDLTTLIEDLNLSESQKEQVKGIIDKYKDDKDNLLECLKEAREQISTVIFAEEFNEAAVRQAAQQLSSIMEELIVLKAKMISELMTVLDPEQIGYLKGRLEAMKEFRRHRRPMLDH